MFYHKKLFGGGQRYLAPLALFLAMLVTALPAAAQSGGQIDLSNILSQGTALLIFFRTIGAIAAVVGIIFSALAIRGRNIGEGIIGVLCAIATIFIIGHASDWVATITGVAVGG
jgi:hypothetical protein